MGKDSGCSHRLSHTRQYMWSTVPDALKLVGVWSGWEKWQGRKGEGGEARLRLAVFERERERERKREYLHEKNSGACVSVCVFVCVCVRVCVVRYGIDGERRVDESEGQRDVVSQPLSLSFSFCSVPSLGIAGVCVCLCVRVRALLFSFLPLKTLSFCICNRLPLLSLSLLPHSLYLFRPPPLPPIPLS